MRRLSLSLALLLLYLTSPAFSAPLDYHIRVPRQETPADATCGGAIGIPIDIEVDAFSALKRPGGFVNMFGTVTPTKDLDGLRLRFEAEGSASIFNNSPQTVGRAPAGAPVDFSLLVRIGARTEGAVHVWAESDQDAGYRWSKRGTLYVVNHGGRLYTGMGDWQRLKRAAIEDDIKAGLVSAEEVKARAKSLVRVPFVRDNRPFVAREFSAEERRINAIVGAHPRSRRDRMATDDHHGSNILVRGTVRWTDENGNTHPIFGASVDIRDSDTGFDETITTVGTDVDGNYEAVVDNDDGIGAGDRDIYVRVRLENTLIDTMSAGLFGGTYEMESGVHDETPNGTTITENFTTANTGTGPAGSVFTSATWIAVYARDRHGFSGSVDVIWPNGDDGSFYDGDVQIQQADRWDWDTIHHEYGHFVFDVLDNEDNPGGPHNIGDCIATKKDDKSEGNRMAWAEGWPTYFGTSGQQVFNMASLNVPRVGDVSYQDLEDSNLVYSLEAQDNNGRGEDNEVAVQRLLWDLFDGNDDSRDAISRSDQSIWNAIDSANPEMLTSGWALLRAGQSNGDQLLMGEIASDHVIGPTLNSPVEGATVSPSGGSSVFSWDRNVGCGSEFDGNSFDLVFYHASTFAPVLTIPNILTGTTYALSEAEIATIISAAGHQVLWGVEGRNTSSPASGPYLGESFQITVNRPPVADAGPDQTVECTSAGTTAVSLNGTGSSDPDGDTLTYAWSMNSVVFSTSATPTGNFPIGTTVVTLRVSDGMASDTDTVSITVQDTTPPVISCPVNITVECTGDLGVQADDPQLAPFFGGVSATDLCDNTPTITNDAPAFFPLGETIVTFTATDDFGNLSTCSATVKVVDTKAPTITATLSAATLWPANHKLVTIDAAVVVTDECDPNPTFVLTSIVSNEPDNGLGDGDAPNDIQGADYGTPDTQFQLRAERAGLLTGRVYTITYTGTDSSGNSAQTQVQVKVPHSMK